MHWNILKRLFYPVLLIVFARRLATPNPQHCCKRKPRSSLPVDRGTPSSLGGPCRRQTGADPSPRVPPPRSSAGRKHPIAPGAPSPPDCGLLAGAALCCQRRGTTEGHALRTPRRTGGAPLSKGRATRRLTQTPGTGRGRVLPRDPGAGPRARPLPSGTSPALTPAPGPAARGPGPREAPRSSGCDFQCLRCSLSHPGCALENVSAATGASRSGGRADGK